MTQDSVAANIAMCTKHATLLRHCNKLPESGAPRLESRGPKGVEFFRRHCDSGTDLAEWVAQQRAFRRMDVHNL